MSAKVIRISDSANAEKKVDVADDVEAEPTPAAGWDPFEVWRTRVLAPRLEEPGAPEPPGQPPKRRRLFGFLRRLLNRR